MKNVKAIILNLFNEEFTLNGYVSQEDLNSTSDNVRMYEEESDEDFFLIKKTELILS